MTLSPENLARRRAILEFYRLHGGPATAREFKISRQRVYQIVDIYRYPITRKKGQRRDFSVDKP